MKKLLLFIPAIALLLISCGGNGEKNSGENIKFQLKPPAEMQEMYYSFSVNQLKSGDITNFYIVTQTNGKQAADGKIELNSKNVAISLDGVVGGKNIKAEAGKNDSLATDVKLVAMPVFSLLNKQFVSVYNPYLRKEYEFQKSDSGFVDSTENRMQFFLSYPENEVTVGQSWVKDLVVKAGRKISCDATYTLTDVKGDTAWISVAGKLGGKGQSFGNDFSVDGNLKGNFKVRISNGWPIHSEINQEFNLLMNEDTIPMHYSIKYGLKK